ncbi:MAG: LysR family transcriptional regulator [Lachnospiraceae bacterium]
MDLKQLEYIVAIEKEQSISRAAEKLFLTQSALNQQLLKLEKELGTPLFERHHHSMIPTFAGNTYLAAARQMLIMKEDTYRIIQDVAAETGGEIAISYTPERGALMFSSVYPKFHQDYPKITFKIREARVKKMEQMVLQKDVTLGLSTYTEHFHAHSLLEYYDIGTEIMVLGVPGSHPLAHLAGTESYRTLPEIDLRLFQNDEFILMGQETRFRDMIDLAFSHAGFKPKVLFEATGSLTILNLVKQQICLAFFPQSYVEKDASIVYFSVPPVQAWTLTFCYLKGAYLTRPERHLMQLWKKHVEDTQTY